MSSLRWASSYSLRADRRCESSLFSPTRPSNPRSVAGDSIVQPGPPPEVLGTRVDLDDSGLLGNELAVGEIGPDEQEQVGILQRLGAPTETDQPGQSDGVGVVVLDPLLPTQRVADRGLEPSGQLEDLGVGLA